MHASSTTQTLFNITINPAENYAGQYPRLIGVVQALDCRSQAGSGVAEATNSPTISPNPIIQASERSMARSAR